MGWKERALENQVPTALNQPSDWKSRALENQPKKDSGMLSKTLEVIDYPRSFVAGLIGKPLGLEGDVYGKQIMERLGVPSTALSDVVPSLYMKETPKTEKSPSLRAKSFVGGEAIPMYSPTESFADIRPQAGGLLDPTASGVAGFATDVAIDPLTYASLGAKGVSKLAQKGSGLLKDIAETRAFKALGPYQRDVLIASEKGKVKDIGRAALEEGIVGTPTSYKGMAERAEKAAGAKGKALEKKVEELAALETAPKTEVPITPISRKEIADNLRKELISPVDTDIAGVAKANENFESMISNFEKGGNEYLPLLEAELKKRKAYEQVNFRRLPGTDVPIEEQFNRALGNKLKTSVEAQAGLLDPSGEFEALKQSYGNLTEAERIARIRGEKEMANRMISPSDYGVGIGGALGGLMTGHTSYAAAGAALGLANNLARKYGNQIMAVGADKISKALMKSAEMAEIAVKDPNLFKQVVGAVVAKNAAKEKK